ncbi:MAG TPA: peptide ABC transporter substrate-binding protein [Coriobacteriia bacterium]|nr:peptide ABC transporter substrate-binding protein [Coriobacteriia bacterium]
MHEKYRRLLGTVVVLSLVAAVGLGGCAPKQTTGEGTEAETDQPKKGGSMSFYIGEPAYIDPYNAQETEGIQVEQTLFDSLTTFDDLDPTKVIPSAADTWESNEDGSVWTFKLNPDGKFSDGTPVKASDFVYAWNRIVNPKTVNTATEKADPSIIGYHLGFIQGYDEVAAGDATEMSGLKAVDDLTFEVTLSQSFADFEYVVAHPSLAPVPQKYVEEGVDFEGEKVAYGDMPIGNGSFKMAEPWKHNQYIKVARNENYAGDAPYLDGIEFKIFKDPETAYTEFEAGNLDFTQIGEGKIADAQAKYGQAADGYTVNAGEQTLFGAENSTYYMILNNKDELFKDPALRKAISLAINRQAICDTVFEGTREPADNILPPGIAGYEKGAWADSKYDMEAAKQALADAGYPEGEGLPTVKLSFNSGAGHEPIMELVQADLKAIGIESEFDSADFPVYLKQLDEGKHQIARLGWVADYPIAYNFLYSLFDSKSGDNKAYYANPAVDQAIKDGETTVDTAARLAEFQQISKTIGADNPVAPLMFYKHHHVGSDRLHDFIFGPMYLGNFDKVWVEDAAAE